MRGATVLRTGVSC